MARISILAAFAAVCALLPSPTSAQAGPNTLAMYNPANRTASSNSTTCILPISKAAAQQITGYAPLDVPASILPGFPAGMHPLLVSSSYENDIRMTALNIVPLQIASLMGGSLIVPYADVLKDGKTPINVPVNNYVGGTNGQTAQAIVPSLAAGVSPFEGTTTFPATFAPDTAAAATLPGGLYSTEAKPYLLPNTVSGPGVYAEAFDILFQLTSASPYTEHTFHALINIPQLLNNGRCQRDTTYFNETFAEPHMAVANVTLYHQILVTPPASIEGLYTDVYCYQANGEIVASTAEDCGDAAANFDPKAKE